MAGATLGGGIGFYSGMYGAISDSLISVSMVSGSGEIITASETENSDLLWGMRGAGFNFGAVTSLTYKIHDSPNDGMAVNTDMLFPISQNGSVWEVVKSYFVNQHKELSIAVGIMFDPDSKQVRTAPPPLLFPSFSIKD
jgi:FAD/FMN-containing dehydrogenase